MIDIKFCANHQYRNDEHLMFVKETVDLGIRYKLAEFRLEEEFEKFRACFNIEDDATKKVNKSALTEKITIADHERDVDFRFFVDSIKAMLNHHDPETVDAAKRMKILTDTYGNLAQKPINEETIGIINLVQDAKGKYAGDVAILKLTGSVSRLETSNGVVEHLVKDRTDEVAERTSLRVKECRLATDRAYAALVDKLGALMKVDGEENYRDFTVRLNTLIDKYNGILAQRKGRAKAKKEKEGEKN